MKVVVWSKDTIKSVAAKTRQWTTIWLVKLRYFIVEVYGGEGQQEEGIHFEIADSKSLSRA